MKKIFLLILMSGLFASSALAHNGMLHVLGTVTAVTDTSISVKTTDGTVQTVVLSGDTKYLRGTTAITPKEIRVGDHIVVHAVKTDSHLTASEVKVGATKTHTETAPSPH